MVLVLGLGNPGSKYDHTRHNAGFDVVDRVAAFFQVRLRKRCFRLYRIAKADVGGRTCALVEPLTYMNSSGEIAPDFQGCDPEEMIVVCDQMDLPVGTIRVRKGGSSAGHNGLKSLISCFGSASFIRVYVGTGRPKQGETVVDHVLSRETDPLYPVALDRAARAVIDLMQGRALVEVEGAYNQRPGS
ncbi:MAG: aminoacyl-tRNA hydrolase [Sphaerochaetaceae bacterium]|nr:aminoacyl-tRNA hydrolase [Spirochaetales bacterium]MDY5498585.1 aminoacyl-tRNA hydrolase [Sphaerochaetaceae bacterium]